MIGGLHTHSVDPSRGKLYLARRRPACPGGHDAKVFFGWATQQGAAVGQFPSDGEIRRGAQGRGAKCKASYATGRGGAVGLQDNFDLFIGPTRPVNKGGGLALHRQGACRAVNNNTADQGNDAERGAKQFLAHRLTPTVEKERLDPVTEVDLDLLRGLINFYIGIWIADPHHGGIYARREPRDLLCTGRVVG